jgi:circadian clock protein KaiB
MKQRAWPGFSAVNRLRSAERRQDAPESDETYLLRLFVAGERPQSLEAKKNIEQICAIHLRERCELTVFDVCEDFTTAVQHGVILTPTLILISPAPRVTLIGNLNDTRKVLEALRLGAGKR